MGGGTDTAGVDVDDVMMGGAGFLLGTAVDVDPNKSAADAVVVEPEAGALTALTSVGGC
jgi:hypothetical protein